MTQIVAVVEQPGEKRIFADLLDDLGGYRADSGDIAQLAVSDVVPSSDSHVVRYQHDQLCPAGACGACAAGDYLRIGVCEVTLEGLDATIFFRFST